MNKRTMKIQVAFTYHWFRELSFDKRKKTLLKYLTSVALNILVKQKMEENKVSQTHSILDSTNLCYLLIGKDLFEFYDEATFICDKCGHLGKQERFITSFRSRLKFCSKKCYRDYKSEQELLLNQKTRVKLQKADHIRQEWHKKEPFNQKIPSEIYFAYNEENQYLKGSFNWKIKIPDTIDQYYWPLIKKEMTSINLQFQPNDLNPNNSAA